MLFDWFVRLLDAVLDAKTGVVEVVGVELLMAAVLAALFADG
jgi:hypothetical protein